MSDHAPLNDPPHTTQEPDTGLHETQVASTLMHQGKFLTFKQDIVQLSDGRNASREYLVHPGVVMMIPPFDDGIVLMERQFRYPVSRVMIEFPVGELDPQEGALAHGERELREETGYTAERQDYLVRIRPVTSYSTEFIGIYPARDFEQGEAMLDENEFLEAFIMSTGQLIDWVRDGKTSDVKTIIGTFWLEKILSGTWMLDAVQAACHCRLTMCFMYCRYHSERPYEKISTAVHEFWNQGYAHLHALDRS